MIRYEVPPMTELRDACRDAIEQARRSQDIVVFEFNGLNIAVSAMMTTFDNMSMVRDLLKDIVEHEPRVSNAPPSKEYVDLHNRVQLVEDEPEFPPVGTEFEDPFEDPFDNDDTPIMSDDALDLIMEYARDCKDRLAAYCIAALVKQVRG